MSGWQSVVVSLVLLSCASCFVDPGTSSASSPTSMPPDDTGSAPSTAGPGESTGTTDPTTEGPTTPVTTTTTTTTTSEGTTGPTCGGLGQPCTGTDCCGCLACLVGFCLPDNSVCGNCMKCDTDGACGPAGKGANCTAQVDVDCTEDVWGVENGTCYAMAPAQPECDGDGACVVPACGEQGDAIVSCPECMLSENTCVPGVKTNEIEVGGFCQTSGETPACESVCRGDALLQRSCAQDGHCQESMDSCAPYVCEAGGCLSSCNTDLDCSGTANCVNGVCE